ncbi:multimeric flavodoxin WrbA [Crossiella equi]|uniref:Multimeric flavodoxin WrbA n=2 Tax=Crossiella equi TaxID=130796 RepID=A0ABS5A406_9PSEU|nr:NAD(P)H-dependent oxidoreductase [Crossiella equi]MBP2471306.1 multimeric flavodoxin WrbA [Crossiella equi]
MRKFLFVLGSSRQDGNTEQLARHAARTLPADVEQRWLWLGDYPLPTFADVRHDAPLPPPTGNVKLLAEATLEATDIVIASPVYWYSVSNTTKTYLDYWSNWLRVPEMDFKARMSAKTLWGISVLAEEDRSRADHLAGMLRNSADYLHMGWAGLLLGNGSKPGDVQRDTEALAAAEQYFAPARV